MEAFKEEYLFLIQYSSNNEELNRRNDNMKYVRLKKSKILYRLDLYMDKDGLMRIGGCLQCSDLLLGECHPIIIPCKGHVIELLMRYFHEDICHLGRDMALSHLRQNGYWIVGGSSVLSSYIRNCVICRKRRGDASGQKIADLPAERLKQEPPFTYCDSNIFDHFLLKKNDMVLYLPAFHLKQFI